MKVPCLPRPLRLFLLVLVALLSLGAAPESLEDDFDLELRPQLGDVQQELLTTGVNWPHQPSRVGLSTSAAINTAETKPVRRAPAADSFRIMLDVGHGGRDLGALGLSGVMEKELCLRIGLLVRKELLKHKRVRNLPVEVRMTRSTDRYLTLHQRVNLANQWGADLFVSIHANASPAARARGFEIYFLSSRASDSKANQLASIENDGQNAEELTSDVMSMLSDARNYYHLEQSSRFAETVFHSVAQRLRANARGVRQGPFTVLAGTLMPAILIEVGYVTHPDESQLLTQSAYLKRLANSISAGIMDFANAMGKLS